jgi:hypothetical protein
LTWVFRGREYEDGASHMALAVEMVPHKKTILYLSV